jgi:chromatin remodeling complex protein RSC6
MSEFNQKHPVNALLTELMGLELGTQVSRREAQIAICTYVRGNNLVDPNHPNLINPDQTIKTLLQSNGVLTYPKIQGGMQWLFPVNEEYEARRVREELMFE